MLRFCNTPCGCRRCILPHYHQINTNVEKLWRKLFGPTPYGWEGEVGQIGDACAMCRPSDGRRIFARFRRPMSGANSHRGRFPRFPRSRRPPRFPVTRFPRCVQCRHTTAPGVIGSEVPRHNLSSAAAPPPRYSEAVKCVVAFGFSGRVSEKPRRRSPARGWAEWWGAPRRSAVIVFI